MPTENRLPVFKLIIDKDAEGMDYMGLVDYPAHGKGWKAFSKQTPLKKVEFKQHFNEDKRIVTGVAIATNLQIFRRREDGSEYNVFFTKEDTHKIAIALAENGYMNNVNEMHDLNKDIKGMVMFESFFIDDEMSNIPAAFSDQNLQPGSWIVSYKVNNDETWEKIKNGEFYGFSIEGWFKEIEVKFTKKNKMKKSFVTISEVSRWNIETFEDDITIGTVLHWNWDGKPEEPIHAGEYEWDGHKIQVDSKGTVVMIDGQTESVTLKKKVKSKKKKMKKKSLFEKLFGSNKNEPIKFDSENKDKYAEATTVDGVVVMWDGDLAEGTALFVVSEEEGVEPILAAEGEYAFPVDGMNMVVTVDEAGIITSVAEAEEMEEEEEEGDFSEEVQEAMSGMKADYEKKFNTQKETFEGQLKVIATQFDELKEAFEKSQEGGEGKVVPTSSKPGWKRTKK